MLPPLPHDSVPAETARIAHAAFPKGNLYFRLRDELGTLYHDQQFAALFSVTGQPALPPWRLALVTVFQFLEGLSDRQAADQVRARLDWKYALGLELEDPGFDFSVLSEFRSRLLAGRVEGLLLDTLLEHFKARGLLRLRGRQRTDSTHVLGAIRRLNRLELVAETFRAALNELATIDPAWLAPRLQSHWVEWYAHRIEEHRLPKGEAAREALAIQVGQDGVALLRALDADDAVHLQTLPKVQVLRLMWTQQFEVGG